VSPGLKRGGSRLSKLGDWGAVDSLTSARLLLTVQLYLQVLSTGSSKKAFCRSMTSPAVIRVPLLIHQLVSVAGGFRRRSAPATP
jgi:hypothetical protein